MNMFGNSDERETNHHAESVDLVACIVDLVPHIIAPLLQLVHKASNLQSTMVRSKLHYFHESIDF